MLQRSRARTLIWRTDIQENNVGPSNGEFVCLYEILRKANVFYRLFSPPSAGACIRRQALSSSDIFGGPAVRPRASRAGC